MRVSFPFLLLSCSYLLSECLTLTIPRSTLKSNIPSHSYTLWEDSRFLWQASDISSLPLASAGNLKPICENIKYYTTRVCRVAEFFFGGEGGPKWYWKHKLSNPAGIKTWDSVQQSVWVFFSLHSLRLFPLWKRSGDAPAVPCGKSTSAFLPHVYVSMFVPAQLSHTFPFKTPTVLSSLLWWVFKTDSFALLWYLPPCWWMS